MYVWNICMELLAEEEQVSTRNKANKKRYKKNKKKFLVRIKSIMTIFRLEPSFEVHVFSDKNASAPFYLCNWFAPPIPYSLFDSNKE